MNYEDLIPESAKKEIAGHIIKLLEDGYGLAEPVSDLHSILFEDFYIVGIYKAKNWINKHFDVFDAIGLVQEFENEEFGKVKTDLSEPEHVVASIVSIIGREILENLGTIEKKWDDSINENDCAQIIEEIRKKFLND